MTPQARLFAKYGRLAGTDLLVADEATLGRNEDNTVVVTSRSTSNHHARIFFDPAEELFYLEDLGSLNGTELDGVPVEGRKKLGRLHIISIAGRHDLIYQGPQLVAARLEKGTQGPPQREPTRVEHQVVPLPPTLGPQPAPESGETPTETPERKPTQVQRQVIPLPAALAPQPPPAKGESEFASKVDSKVDSTVDSEEDKVAVAPHFQLVFTNFEQSRRAELEEGENTVGRSVSVQIQIESPEISRLHAVLKVHGTTVTVRDEGSHNKTYLDGVLVDRETAAKPGAVLRFGTIEARLQRVDE